MHKNWIAVDWGTSNLRAWLMNEGQALSEATSADGMSSLAPDEFEPTLLRLVAPWLADDAVMQVIACGMIGARQGWCEAPYLTVPAAPLDAQRFVAAPCRDLRLKVTIINGVSQMEPADVMRGEETQLAGLIHIQPDFEGTVCLPGTHSKWALVRDGRIESFTTFLTGELFGLLRQQSVLRHVTGEGVDHMAFAGGVSDGVADPGGLIAELFGIRARALLKEQLPAVASSRLSGLLIGAEIAAARRRFGGAHVTVIGTPSLADRYRRALRQSSSTVDLKDGTALTLAGLAAARAALMETSQ